MNRLFVLPFEYEDDRSPYFKYYTPTIEIKDFNVLIDGKIFFDVPVKNKEEEYEKIIEMSNNNDYTTSNLLDTEYFSKHCKLIAIDLSRQTDLENPDLKQQINFIGKVKEDKASMFFIIETTNLLSDSSNEESKFAIKNGISWTVKLQKINTIQIVLLSLKQRLLNQVFVIILMHLF